MPGLEQVFNAFCTFGGGQAGHMDNAKFAKLCHDSGLINKKFTSTDADIIIEGAIGDYPGSRLMARVMSTGRVALIS